MSLNTCSVNHDEIVHEGRDCPFCAYVDEHDSIIAELNDKVSELEAKDTSELTDKIKELETELARVIKGQEDGEK